MMAAQSLVIRASSFFAIRHSSFIIVYLAFIKRMEDHRFLSRDIFPNKDQFRPIAFKWLHFPPASHEIEKVRPIVKANETLRPDHVRRQSACETFEGIAGENFVGAKSERFKLGLMSVPGLRNFFLTSDTE
jgi:hypothetical protein